MGERPLPDEVARAARAYLAALVSPSARADAWHDLLAEVRYWQDDQLIPVLRLAHQVVSQHQRVTDEAAAHALVDVGLTEVDDLAAILDASLDTARDLRERVERVRVPGERARDVSDGGQEVHERASDGRPAQPAAADTQAVTAESQGMVDPTPMTVTAPTSPSSTQASTPATAPAVRIGFDDQDAVGPDASDDDSDHDSDLGDADDGEDQASAGLLTYRRLVGIAVVVWVLVVVAWLLGGS